MVAILCAFRSWPAGTRDKREVQAAVVNQSSKAPGGYLPLLTLRRALGPRRLGSVEPNEANGSAVNADRIAVYDVHPPGPNWLGRNRRRQQNGNEGENRAHSLIPTTSIPALDRAEFRCDHRTQTYVCRA